MLTLLRCAAWRFRRRPELDGFPPASSAGSRSLHFQARRALTNYALRHTTAALARTRQPQTTNLGVSSSNLFGRAAPRTEA